MHNKGILISAINNCLQQKSNTSVILNKTELYAGLADAYTHYLLENKLDLFFDALETLSTQPHNYHFGEDFILDAFIIQIDKMTHSKPIITPPALETPWWEIQRDHLLTLASTYSPCYVYKSAIQTNRAKQLLALKAIDTLFYAIKANPHPSILNTLQKEGGGLGIVEKPGQQPLDLATLDASLLEVKALYPQLKFWMEPGRFFVAESGVLLAKMTQGKEKDEVKFIGIETGMNSLIRPALYGSYHEIVNLNRFHEEKTELCHIVGPICESGDTLGYDRLMPLSQEGDVFLIANAGAYGHSMSSYYNLRASAQEIILE